MLLNGRAPLSAALAAEGEIHRAVVETLPLVRTAAPAAAIRDAVEHALEPARAELLRLAGGAVDELQAPELRVVPGLTPRASLHALLLLELVRWQGRAHPAMLAGIAPALDMKLPADFVRRVPGADPAGDALPEVVAAAREAYTEIQGIIEALHPPDRRPLKALAGVMNQQAGRYPIADDLREIAAGLRAGHRSWLRFPYYRARYGDRGRRFTWSDSAWLASLPVLPKAGAWHEIDWMARLLSARGMPQWMTEEHLVLLHEELCRAVPERSARYAVLADGAAMLRGNRRRQLSQAAMDRLAVDFDAAVGADLSARHPDTGALLAAAVADERLGVETAVVRIEAFFADVERFPPHWIAAVRDTLARARTL